MVEKHRAAEADAATGLAAEVAELEAAAAARADDATAALAAEAVAARAAAAAEAERFGNSMLTSLREDAAARIDALREGARGAFQSAVDEAGSRITAEFDALMRELEERSASHSARAASLRESIAAANAAILATKRAMAEAQRPPPSPASRSLAGQRAPASQPPPPPGAPPRTTPEAQLAALKAAVRAAWRASDEPAASRAKFLAQALAAAPYSPELHAALYREVRAARAATAAASAAAEARAAALKLFSEAAHRVTGGRASLTVPPPPPPPAARGPSAPEAKYVRLGQSAAAASWADTWANVPPLPRQQQQQLLPTTQTASPSQPEATPSSAAVATSEGGSAQDGASPPPYGIHDVGVPTLQAVPRATQSPTQRASPPPPQPHEKRIHAARAAAAAGRPLAEILASTPMDGSTSAAADAATLEMLQELARQPVSAVMGGGAAQDLNNSDETQAVNSSPRVEIMETPTAAVQPPPRSPTGRSTSAVTQAMLLMAADGRRGRTAGTLADLERTAERVRSSSPPQRGGGIPPPRRGMGGAVIASPAADSSWRASLRV